MLPQYPKHRCVRLCLHYGLNPSCPPSLPYACTHTSESGHVLSVESRHVLSVEEYSANQGMFCRSRNVLSVEDYEYSVNRGILSVEEYFVDWRMFCESRNIPSVGNILSVEENSVSQGKFCQPRNAIGWETRLSQSSAPTSYAHLFFETLWDFDSKMTSLQWF
jgi:hypothetical protein